MLSPALTTCLGCGGSSLAPLLALYEEGAGHGAAGHRFSYGYGVLSACGACGRGQLESYSHDCFHHYEDEPWDMYWWYALGVMDVALLRSVLDACPAAHDPSCGCAPHESLRESARRLWGGVPHAVAPGPGVKFAWLRLDERDGRLTLVVDEARGR